ncbi:MAG TPA: DUF423 domain-containing protein [Casimicrobiaceae bacterium]|nr:DUF423 domain-containing protein [Casimicrobiaceae bacterium]
MTPNGVIVAAALLLFVAVGAGAFGAHALRGMLAPELFAAFQTGVQYHFVHAIGALLVAILWLHWPQASALAIVCALLIAGIVLFSGSLYALAITGIRGFGAVTPFGGVAWLAAWLVLAYAAWRGQT